MSASIHTPGDPSEDDTIKRSGYIIVLLSNSVFRLLLEGRRHDIGRRVVDE